MMRTFQTLIAGLALALSAGVAQAEETHQIDMIGDALFPPVLQARVGDTVVFYNRGAEDGTVQASDATWSVGPVSEGASASLVITEGMTLTFAYATIDMDDAVIELITSSE